MKIKYLKHPVTPEQVQAANIAGYQIIDIKFAPKDYVEEKAESVEEKPAKKRGRPKKSDIKVEL